MMLVEETTVSASSLPVEQFKAHLRLGTGFADDSLQDAVLESFLRAAMAAIEARTGKILLEREFSWSVSAWRDDRAQALPIAPVREIIELAIVARDGTEVVIDPATYWLERDHSRPRLVATSRLRGIAVGSVAEVVFLAGFAQSFDALPADIAQAILMLAAYFYEHRDATNLGDMSVPYGVSVLIERYKTIRLVAGGRS